MRCLLVAAIVAFSSPAWAQFFEARPGSEVPAAAEAPLAVDTPAPIAETSVVITPVPMPASVIEILQPIERSPKLRTARKASPLKKPLAFPNILLSRTERHQFALLAAASANSGKVSASLRRFLYDENNESGYDELVLQRFYSRPRVASDPTDADSPDSDDLSAAVKLRLLLARLKAVEAHALAQVADPGDDLSDAIRQRLAAARQTAVAAHRRKFA